jgi:hypothetical protein
MQRRDFIASRKAGIVAAVSHLALIILAALDASLDHDGIKPQRMMGNGWVGAML